MSIKQGILTSISNLDVCLNVNELKGATAKMNLAGMPYVHTGGYNMVFQLEHNRLKWAFRVWHVSIPEIKEQVIKTATYLRQIGSEYFADFIYEEQALLVEGEYVDAVRMQWLEGTMLKDYLSIHKSDSDKIIKIADRFVEMCISLRSNKISHGDLQHGNIIIDPNGELRLIDYDSLCIAEFEGRRENIFGLKGYQHPSRFSKGIMSLTSDYFSELVIYLSLLALSEQPELWERYEVLDSERLLFDHQDFLDFSSSLIYKDLIKLSPKINALVKILDFYLKEDDYFKLKPFLFYLNDPEILEFNVSPTILIPGIKPTVTWKVSHAAEVKLQNQIVSSEGQTEVVVDTNNTMVSLVVKGFSKTITDEISVSVHPTPIIRNMELPNICLSVYSDIHVPEFNLPVSEITFNQVVSTKTDTTVYSDLNTKMPLFNLNYPNQFKFPEVRLKVNSFLKRLPKIYKE